MYSTLVMLSVQPLIRYPRANTNNNNNVDVADVGSAVTSAQVDGMSTSEQVRTTTFTSDKTVVEATPNLHVQVPKSLSARDTYRTTIEDYLSKPFVFQTGSLGIGDTVSTFGQALFPQTFNSNPIILDKLRGYFGFTADIEFRIVVNATRFQQGRYILAWTPFGGASSIDNRVVAISSSHRATLVQRTQLPHVEIDINCDTQATLYIPYKSMYAYTPSHVVLNGSSAMCWGSLSLTPYEPLDFVSGSSTASFTIYYSLKNIDLIGVAVPQSGRFSARRGKDAVAAEQDSQAIGPISSMMTRVSNAASLWTAVPLISTYATTTQWCADLLSKTANVFGLSRPTNLERGARVVQQLFPYLPNVDGADNSNVLALSTTNQVGMLEGASLTDMDEMDFKFICSIPSYWFKVDWADSAASGSTLTTFPLSPYEFGLTSTVNGQLVNHFTPMGFVANHFNYWRGSMVIIIKIVKTEFHSGRLAFVFQPLETRLQPNVAPAYNTTSYAHRDIIDIREHSEITLRIPFVSITPFKSAETIGTRIMGNLSVYVVDKLVAPDVVPSSVTLIVEACMGADVEFAVPSGQEMMPFYNVIPQSGVFTTQPDANVCNIVDKTIGSLSTDTASVEPSLFCVGEVIRNARTLLKRPMPILYDAQPAVNKFLNVYPYLTTGFLQNGLSNVVPTTGWDSYNVWSSLYLYSRGGVRLKFIDPDLPAASNLNSAYTWRRGKYRYVSNTVIADQSSIVTYTATGPNSEDTGFAYRQNFNLLAITENNWTQEIQMPQYFLMPVRNKYTHFGAKLATYNYSVANQDATQLSLVRTLGDADAPLSSSQASRVCRSGSDDMNFSYFISVPPMVRNYASF